jgi:hypothetical protein
MAAAATKTETMTADNNADNGDTTAAATTTEATNDDGDTTVAATTTEAMDDNGNTTAAATPTEATNDDGNMMAATTPTEARISEDDDDDDDDGDTAATTTEETPAPISIDQPESAATEVEEAREQLLLDAAKHVKMAREQRALYQAHVAEAVCDATNGKSHSERSHPNPTHNIINRQTYNEPLSPFT